MESSRRHKDKIERAYAQTISDLIARKVKSGEIEPYSLGKAVAFLYVLDDELTLAEAEEVVINQVNDAAVRVTG